MPYIIDGHNLIAAMPGIDLEEARDERALLEQLQAFSQRQGRTLHVYFDRGHAGGRNQFRLGRLHVRFSVPPRSADDAIRSKLRSIGSEAPNWVIVSSDREIRDQARRAGARSMTSTAFSQKLQPQEQVEPTDEKPSYRLTDEEIEAWEARFRQGTDEI